MAGPKFFFAQTKAAFKEKVEDGTVGDNAFAFILDEAQLYTHGKYYQFVAPNLFYNTSDTKVLGKTVTTDYIDSNHIINRWQVDGETITGTVLYNTDSDSEFKTIASPFPDPDETSWTAYHIFSGDNFYRFKSSFLKYLLIDEITNWGGAFRSNTELTTIPDAVFSSQTQITSVDAIFSGCSSLTSAYQTFAGCTALTSAASAFKGCTSLISARYAFYNNTGLSSIDSCFSGCTALEDARYAFATSGQSNLNSTLTSAEDVFAGCTSLKNALYTFAYCSTLELDSNPFADALSTLTNCQAAFNCCYKLTDNVESWFSNFTALTTCRLAFGSCGTLTSARHAFYGCTGLTTAFKAFYYSTKLADVSGTFVKCTALENASYVFANCTALSTVISSTLDYASGNEYGVYVQYYGTFYLCNNITNFSYCFYKDTALTLFCSRKLLVETSSWSTTTYDGQDFTNVTDSTDMFYGCTALTALYIANLGAAESSINLDSSTGLQNWVEGLDYTISKAYDRASAGLSTATIYLHEDVVARLTDDQITELTDKGFTISEMS